MTAIPASSVRLKTMADGSLQITMNVEPRHASAAFALFGMPGTPAALAALKVGTELPAEDSPEPTVETVKDAPRPPSAEEMRAEHLANSDKNRKLQDLLEQQRATALSVCGLHKSGLTGGAKPSRNTLSACGRCALSITCASPIKSVSSTCPPSNASRCTPGTRP